MDYAKKALAHMLVVAVLVLYVGFVIVGSFHFWSWYSGGSAYGLVAALATIASLLGGPIIAANKEAP